MSGGSNQTTQTQTTQPYGRSKDILNQGFNDVLKAYREGYGTDIYEGSTVIPHSLQTEQSLTGLQGLATQNAGTNGMGGQLQNIINNGGFNNQQLGALNTMRGNLNALGSNGLNRTQDSALGGYQQQLQSLGPNGLSRAQDSVMNNMQSGLRNLGANGLTRDQDNVLGRFTDTATRDYSIGGGNPGFDRVLQATQDAAGDQVNLGAAARGRYGSGIHQGSVAREVGKVTDSMVNDDFNRFLGRQDTANQNINAMAQQGIGNRQGYGSQISSLAQQGIGNRSGMYNNIAGLGGQGFQQQQSGAANLFNANQSGLGNMTAAYDAAQNPYRTLAGVGASYEDLAKRVKDDELRIFDARNNQPYDNIQRLMSFSGYGTPYAPRTTVSTTPGQNPFLQAIGIGTGGLGLLGQLGSMF